MAASSKVGYCIMDVCYYPSPETQQPGRPWPQYQGCNNQVQSLSAGWSDIYEYYRPDQWVDISDLPDGLYALHSTVYPDDLLCEGDEHNNTRLVFIFSSHGYKLQALTGLRWGY